VTKATTRFERWLERRRLERADTEELYENPLNARIGGVVNLTLPGWEDLDFKVLALRQVVRNIGDEAFPFTDYRLLSRDMEGNEFHYGLRYIPLDEPDLESGLTHRVFLLTPVMEHEYDEALDDDLHDCQPVTYKSLNAEGEEVEETWSDRVDGVELPYECVVHTLSDQDHDGEVDRDEVEEETMVFFDFERSTRVEGQIDQEVEYLFIEIDDTGFTTYLHATEIGQETVRYS